MPNCAPLLTVIDWDAHVQMPSITLVDHDGLENSCTQRLPCPNGWTFTPRTPPRFSKGLDMPAIMLSEVCTSYPTAYLVASFVHMSHQTGCHRLALTGFVTLTFMSSLYLIHSREIFLFLAR